MTAFKFDRFKGLLPRVPESLLPPANATEARNCEFAYGELRNLKGDFLAQTLTNAPASLYTDTGLTFYSWPDDVNAARSPLANDPFDRLYYTTPGDFRVAQRAGMSINGGAPASSYRVGVPRPSVAPTMTVPTAPSIETSTLAATFCYEYAGVKYQEGNINLETVATNSKWTFTPPAKAAPPATPAQAFAVIRLVATDNATHDVLFDIYTENSSFSKDGDWSLALTQNTDGASYSLALTSSAVADKETRAYIYTYVNTYGEEGPPSPPATITALAKLIHTVTVTRDALTADYAPIKEIRIYHTPSGSDIADYFYAGAIPVLTASGTVFLFKDDVAAAELNEPLASENYYAPTPSLVGLLALPNGILMAWKGNELHFSDAYKPWSWPPQYVKTFPHNIVGAVAIGAGVLITTLADPYVVDGISPDSMTERKINSAQAGVSKWAMADVMGMIAYASHDGIVVIDGSQATLGYSEQFFTRDVWRARYGAGLSSMRFAVWDGRLVVYSSANAFAAFMIDLDEAKGALTDLPNLDAKCSFVSPMSDQFYYASGNRLFQFGGGSDVEACWRSREIVLNSPVNFGIAQALCEGEWTVSLMADGVVKHTEALTGAKIFRLPSGFLSARWMVTITGTGRFRELRVAGSAPELGAI